MYIREEGEWSGKEDNGRLISCSYSVKGSMLDEKCEDGGPNKKYFSGKN